MAGPLLDVTTALRSASKQGKVSMTIVDRYTIGNSTKPRLRLQIEVVKFVVCKDVHRKKLYSFELTMLGLARNHSLGSGDSHSHNGSEGGGSGGSGGSAVMHGFVVCKDGFMACG